MAAVQQSNLFDVVEGFIHHTSNLLSDEQKVKNPDLTKQELDDVLEHIIENLGATRTSLWDAIGTVLESPDFLAAPREETHKRLRRMLKAATDFQSWTKDLRSRLQRGGLLQWLQQNPYLGQAVTKGDLVNKADSALTDQRSLFLFDLFQYLDSVEGSMNTLWIAIDNTARRLA